MSDESRARGRILVATYEATAALAIETSLQALGFEVTGKATSADQALSSAAAARPDVALIGIQLRGERDGIETAVLLRRDHGVPVTFLTASVDPETIERAKQASPSGFLLEPFDDAELSRVVESALQRAHTERAERDRERNRDAGTPVRGRVLLIDDEPLVVQAVTRVLASLHDVTAVSSGRAAVELLQGGASFDVVLCDLMMPGMGGAEVYEWIASARADLLPRFVFLTGGATDAKSADLLASMPNASVEKPFSPTSLRALVTNFVTRLRT